MACEDVNAQGEPLLQGAAPLYGPEGGLDGYLVVSLYQSGLRQLVAGKYGVQNSLLVVDRFWQPVYCDQPSQAAARAEGLRQSGSGEADGFAALADALEAKKGKWEHDNGT